MDALPKSAKRIRIKALVALSMAFAAGCVDIIGYISFGRVFTAHMTGTTVHLGEHLVHGNWWKALEMAAMLVSFVGGSVVGRAVIEVGSRWRLRSIAAVPLMLEAFLIAIAIPSGWHQLIALVLLASAMGVQTATLTRVGSLTIHTTFVTGMLNKLAQLLSHVSFLTYDASRHVEGAVSARRKVLLEARFIFGVWFLYTLGAVIGTWMKLRWGVPALILPAALISMLAILDLVSPLAIQEERDQSER
ncbi:MAG TPA: YoaK family protein [Candidatus Sulfotelmatobacter sp.]|jgi:uncharacterized membrane protein YoaK (UPF0700 family)